MRTVRYSPPLYFQKRPMDTTEQAAHTANDAKLSRHRGTRRAPVNKDRAKRIIFGIKASSIIAVWALWVAALYWPFHWFLTVVGASPSNVERGALVISIAVSLVGVAVAYEIDTCRAWWRRNVVVSVARLIGMPLPLSNDEVAWMVEQAQRPGGNVNDILAKWLAYNEAGLWTECEYVALERWEHRRRDLHLARLAVEEHKHDLLATQQMLEDAGLAARARSMKQEAELDRNTSDATAHDNTRRL